MFSNSSTITNAKHETAAWHGACVMVIIGKVEGSSGHTTPALIVELAHET